VGKRESEELQWGGRGKEPSCLGRKTVKDSGLVGETDHLTLKLQTLGEAGREEGEKKRHEPKRKKKVSLHGGRST